MERTNIDTDIKNNLAGKGWSKKRKFSQVLRDAQKEE
jgi:hypothetical protein